MPGGGQRNRATERKPGRREPTRSGGWGLPLDRVDVDVPERGVGGVSGEIGDAVPANVDHDVCGHIDIHGAALLFLGPDRRPAGAWPCRPLVRAHSGPGGRASRVSHHDIRGRAPRQRCQGEGCTNNGQQARAKTRGPRRRVAAWSAGADLVGRACERHAGPRCGRTAPRPRAGGAWLLTVQRVRLQALTIPQGLRESLRRRSRPSLICQRAVEGPAGFVGLHALARKALSRCGGLLGQGAGGPPTRRRVTQVLTVSDRRAKTGFPRSANGTCITFHLFQEG